MHASTTYGFKTTELSEDDVKLIWENIKVDNNTKAITLDSIVSPIVSFDVSENGIILLGLKGNKIVVLDEKSNIINYYQFSNDGTFYVQWENNNILLLLIRGSIIVEFTTDGHLISLVRADDKSIENNNLWNKIMKNDNITIGNYTYRVRNQSGFLNYFLSSYSQLIKTDSDGNETTIYDVSETKTTKTITIFIGVILFITIIIVVILFEFKKARRQ